MQKILVWIGILLVVVVGGKYVVDHMSTGAHENTATLRVEGFLDGMIPGGDFQEAFNMWLLGTPSGLGTIRQDQYNAYVGEIGTWMAERGLGNRIKTYEINGATLVKPAEGIEGSVVDVSCTIDGKAVVIRAVERERLTWSE